ncbi:cutinase family protein [Streptomyces violascens]|uniref:cutinase family protein n=1 Tax=Streptomyces violascens TaxID=67381 RepID=UPI0037B7B699
MFSHTTRSLVRKATMLAGATVLSLAGITAAPITAHAAAPHHYYLELGGTGSVAADGTCNGNFVYANQHLNGGTPVPVCYPSSGGPFIGSHNEVPALTAPSFGASVNTGYHNALNKLQDIHRSDPDARFTIVGYSQGAWVADLLLQTVSANGTEVPREKVNGMLYADPLQPGTGFWHLVPKGVPLPLVAISPGTGPQNFPGVPVQRFCIHTDGICDATSLKSFNGFLNQHPKYFQDGNIMTQTIGHDGNNGIVWLPAE